MNKYYFSSAFLVLFLSINTQAQSNIPKPAEPVYEQCGQIAVVTESGTIMQTDYACLQRNNFKSQQYNAALDSYNRALRVSNSNTTDLVRPTEPTYESCPPQMEGMYSACDQRNDALRRDYEFQLTVYNKARTEQENSSQNSSLANVQNSSALGGANQAQSKNDDSKKIYELAAMGCTLASAYYFTMWAVTYCGTSTFCTPSNQQNMVMYSVFAGLAQSQAQNNASSGYQACQVASQLTSGSGSCALPNAFDPYQSLNSLFDANGRCIGNQADCNAILGKMPPGTNIKDAMKGLSSFANNKKAIKVDKDGNLIDSKTGKKYPAGSITESDLIAMGLSPSSAKSMLADMKKNGASVIAGYNNNKASTMKVPPKLELGGPAASSPTLANKNNSNGSLGAEKDLDKRTIASTEGLVREFNGEQIGVAGDDIFKMMSRRYLLKDSQDSFVAP